MILHLGFGVEVSTSHTGMGIVAGLFSRRVGFKLELCGGPRAYRKGYKGEVLVARLL